MSSFVQHLMVFALTTRFGALGQAILFRGANLSVVWPQFLTLAAIGAAFFTIALPPASGKPLAKWPELTTQPIHENKAINPHMD